MRRGVGPAISAGPTGCLRASRFPASCRARPESRGSARIFSGRRILTAADRSRRNGNTTIRLEPYGSQQLSPFNILNLRANKDFRMSGGRRISLDFDIFNLLNSATPTGADFASGSDVRLCDWRHAAAHYAHWRAVHFLTGELYETLKIRSGHRRARLLGRRGEFIVVTPAGNHVSTTAVSAVAQLRHEPSTKAAQG